VFNDKTNFRDHHEFSPSPLICIKKTKKATLTFHSSSEKTVEVSGGENMFFAALLNLCLGSALAQINSPFGVEPDWSAQATIDPIQFPNGRSNIYQWDQKTFTEKVERGQQHALHYPVAVTGLLLPSRPSLKILDAKPGDPLFA
jgi:hypothetical protein